jgi:hypothetical protein
VYGSLDCALFTCDAIEQMTGRDIAAWFRGRYQTRREAFELVREYTGRASLLAIVERVTRDNQMPEVGPLFLQRGDVALIRRGVGGFSLGIVNLNGLNIATVRKTGLAIAPMYLALRGWRV